MLLHAGDLDRVVGVITADGFVVRIEILHLDFVQIAAILFPRILLVSAMRFLRSEPETKRLAVRSLIQKILEVAGVVDAVDAFVGNLHLAFLKRMSGGITNRNLLSRHFVSMGILRCSFKNKDPHPPEPFRNEM